MILPLLCFLLSLSATLLGAAPSYHVSPAGGAEGADGSYEKPFGFHQALEAVGAGPAKLLILSGTFAHRVDLPAVPGAGALHLAAAPGATVVFEGGSPVAEWEARGNLFAFRAEGVRPAYSSEPTWLDVWEAANRRRYRVQADEAGTRAYPHSATLARPGHVLARLAEGATPESVQLWRNREGNGLDIERDHVTVEGLAFRNYTGARQARAITVRGSGITLRHLQVHNAVRGIVISGSGVRVEACELRDVGQGISGMGVDLAIADCTIEAATGPFAFPLLNPHLRNGIRIYHPAVGARVERCTTRGFWAGLYIKTSPPLDPALAERRFDISHNTFLDGIRWGGGQSLASYRSNLIGPDEEGANPLAQLPGLGAVLEGNYFFNTHPGNEANRAGGSPFRDSAAGDLRLKDGVALPPDIGSGAERVAWLTTEEPAAKAAATGPLVQEVVAASSRVGAVITVRLSRPASGRLRYRARGEATWQTVRGLARNQPEPAIVFALTDERLLPETSYEYELALAGDEAHHPGSFTTQGGPKTLEVASGEEGALQDALDRALPGDTVRLAPGIHTGQGALLHGGQREARITIEGSGAQETILDGGHTPEALLELREAPWVSVRNLGLRWFRKAGVSALKSEGLVVEGCRFQNTPLAGGSPFGHGVFLRESPGATLEGNLFTRLEYGLMAHDSPRLRALRNTTFLNLYAGIYLYRSSEGSELRGNSLTFTGNVSLRIVEPDAAAFASLVSDENNFAAALAPLNEAARRAYAAKGITPEQPELRLTPAGHYQLGTRGQSKRLITAQVGSAEATPYFTLEAWQHATGKDARSLFADPLYTNPQEGDFTLLPTSPNLLPGGRAVGAFSTAKP